MIKTIRSLYKKEGFFLLLVTVFRMILNKIYNRFTFNRKDICVDYTATIKGISNISIGENFYCGKYLWLWAVDQCVDQVFTPKIVIKNNVCMNDFIHIGATNYVEIGNNVLMASKIYITDHNHGKYSGSEQTSPLQSPAVRTIDKNKCVVIGDNVWIGEFVSILPGVTIGQGCVIGANSVVTKDVPEFSIAVGNPAKPIKVYDFQSMVWKSIKNDEKSE